MLHWCFDHIMMMSSVHLRAGRVVCHILNVSVIVIIVTPNYEGMTQITCTVAPWSKRFLSPYAISCLQWPWRRQDQSCFPPSLGHNEFHSEMPCTSVVCYCLSQRRCDHQQLYSMQFQNKSLAGLTETGRVTCGHEERMPTTANMVSLRSVF